MQKILPPVFHSQMSMNQNSALAYRSVQSKMSILHMQIHDGRNGKSSAEHVHIFKSSDNKRIRLYRCIVRYAVHGVRCEVYYCRAGQVLRLAGVPGPRQCKAAGRSNHTQPHPSFLAVQPSTFQNNDKSKVKMKRRACCDLLTLRRIVCSRQAV